MEAPPTAETFTRILPTPSRARATVAELGDTAGPAGITVAVKSTLPEKPARLARLTTKLPDEP